MSTHGTMDSAARVMVGRTETRRAKREVVFDTPVRAEYRFEELQPITVSLYRERDCIGGLSAQEHLGECNSDLTKVWEESPFEDVLVNAQSAARPRAGRLRIVTEEEKTVEKELVLRLTGESLEAKNAVGTSDPFLVISRVIDQEFVPVAKTEYVSNVTPQKHAEWHTLHIKVDRLCGGDQRALLLFEVFDWEMNGRHRSIGSCITNLASLLWASPESTPLLELVNSLKKVNPHYVSSGLVRVLEARLEPCYTFLDYLRGGQEINLSVAIDFSKSNLPFDNPGSLHYRQSDNKNNEYMTVLHAVGNVLCSYDKDQEFPMYGFGAKCASEFGAETSQCFPCTFRDDAVEVSGLNGIAETYWKCLSELEPVEPTNLAPVIRKVTAAAAAAVEAAKRDAAHPNPPYQVLLILTDGAVADMRQAIDAVVEASMLPISILIVGVGYPDSFSKMEVLDADDNPLVASNGVRMQRDCVGFVPFRRFRDSPELLARECLKEIPRQFTSWARRNDIKAQEARERLARPRREESMYVCADNPNRLPSEELERMARERRSRGRHQSVFGAMAEMVSTAFERPARERGNSRAPGMGRRTVTNELSMPLLSVGQADPPAAAAAPAPPAELPAGPVASVKRVRLAEPAQTP
eukprot:TRINITY_DN65162_c0_g1_i1.p1 TRINITY_DN65162_c0_g1~~TRINITY_DN65162_c0_g1_i1.p1  ORF type:complete len:726 (+),score=258.12 TRINITY_DN65162_c0_g1_i1:270-2180(+)